MFFQLVKMACDLWKSPKKVQFEFLHLSEPTPAASDENWALCQELKKLQIAKIEFLYANKGPSTSNTHPKKFFTLEKCV